MPWAGGLIGSSKIPDGQVSCSPPGNRDLPPSLPRRCPEQGAAEKSDDTMHMIFCPSPKIERADAKMQRSETSFRLLGPLLLAGASLER